MRRWRSSSGSFFFFLCAIRGQREYFDDLRLFFYSFFGGGLVFFFFWFPFNFRGRRSEKIPNKSNLFVFIGKKGTTVGHRSSV